MSKGSVFIHKVIIHYPDESVVNITVGEADCTEIEVSLDGLVVVATYSPDDEGLTRTNVFRQWDIVTMFEKKNEWNKNVRRHLSRRPKRWGNH